MGWKVFNSTFYHVKSWIKKRTAKNGKKFLKKTARATAQREISEREWNGTGTEAVPVPFSRKKTARCHP
jgi:hypothetical protein